jgi:glucosamine-6-phosphate deaminase
MEVVILSTADAVGVAGARLVAGLLGRKPDAVLALPTGRTPQPLYAELVRLHREEHLSFARATTFNLDEYVGLAADHPASFRRYMEQALFDKVDLSPARIHVPDGLAADIPASCAAYEAAMAAAGGLDLAVLGLGADGHIAFNEPTSSLGSRTRLKTISEGTRTTNQPAFGAEPVPPHVITMGIATILSARRCVLLATGARKAAALAKTVEGPVTALVPSSALQLHPHVTVLCDEAAAIALSLSDYYRAVDAAKPAWQRE